MEKKEYYIKSKIAAKIVELQLQHSLPVNITIGECACGLKHVIFEYESVDYNIVKWLMKKGEAFYLKLTLDEKWEFDD